MRNEQMKQRGRIGVYCNSNNIITYYKVNKIKDPHNQISHFFFH